ncbi:putative transcription regulator A20-like family [Helianthus annuus]|nr:putative transcription regulator A20-like family [Helianthus annuus]
MEKNDTGCQATLEAPILCVNNCGFFGTPATMNMCSKCHKDMILKQEEAKLAASSIESIVNGQNINKTTVLPNSAGSGHVFCSVHRYSDKHDCQFDYRATAKDAIAKANPVVKAEKLDKI